MDSRTPPISPAPRIDLLRFLARRFVLVLPVFVVAVGLTAYATVRTQYLDNAGRRTMALARQMNADLVAEVVTADGRLLPSDTWITGSRGLRIHKLVRRNLDKEVLAITLFAAGGRIIYTTRPGRAEPGASDPSRLASALAGEARWSVGKTDEHDSEGDMGWTDGPPLTSFLPVFEAPGYPSASKTIGAFEIQLSLDTTRADLRALAWVIVAGSLAILLALFVILTMVAKQAAVLVHTERAAQQRLEHELARTVAELEERVIQRTADLSSERELLATILDEAPSAFVLLDQHATVLFKSRQFDLLMDSRPPDSSRANGDACAGVPARSKTSHCRHCGHPESGCAARAAIRDGRPHTIVNAWEGRGNVRWLEHRAVPLSPEESNVRVIEMITDVTAQEESQQRLARASTLALTGELAATVVHEVRNAATTTKLLLQLWAEREPPDSKHGESLAVAMASVARMEVLAENLLRVGRLADREWRECDLVQVVRGAVELIRPETYRRSITLAVDSPADPLVCRADPGMLAAAFLNVLLNATQAMANLPTDSRRELTVRVGSELLSADFEAARAYPYGSDLADHPGYSGTQLSRGSQVVFVEVQDTGPGIARENRDRVFEPFFTTKESGTGLGLPITSRIVKQHGGRLVVSSTPGSGTTIRVVLPAGVNGQTS